MKLVRVIVFVVVVSLAISSCAGRFNVSAREAGETVRPWAVVRGDCAGLAYSGEGSGKAEIMWYSNTKIPIIAGPVAGDGVIFVPVPNRRVIAFDAESGKRLGRLWIEVLPNNGLALGDGLLALSGRSDFNRLRVYDYRSGDFLWENTSDRAFAAPIFCGDALYYTTAKGAVFSIDARTGERNWRTEISGAVIEYEPAFRDSLLYIADSNKRLVAMTADSGAVRWTVNLASPPCGQPVVIPDHVIVPTSSGKIYAVLLDGSIRLTIDSPGEMGAGIACSGPTVFGVTTQGVVFAGDLGQGGIYWQTNLNTPVIAPPVLWGKQVAVVTAEGELKLLYYSDGAVESDIDLGSPVSAPPIIYNNKLYIATEKGELIAITRNYKKAEEEDGSN